MCRGEEQVIEAAIRGDEVAYKALYDAHVGFLYGVALRYIADRDSAKDVLQNAFIKIFSSLHRFQYQGEGAFRAWAKRILINEAVSWIRREQRFVPMEAELLPEEDSDKHNETLPEEEEISLGSLTEEELLGVIQELPEGYRMVFNLYAIEGCSHREIATKLGISEGTSASQYARAKKRLREQLQFLVSVRAEG